MQPSRIKLIISRISLSCLIALQFVAIDMGPIDMNCLNPSHQRPQMGHSVVRQSRVEPLVLYRLTDSIVWTRNLYRRRSRRVYRYAFASRIESDNGIVCISYLVESSV